MTATVAQIAQVRRMVAEPDVTTYTDADIAAYIEQYPLLDAFEYEPWIIDYITTPPTQTENPNWTPTYDLNRAAADIWSEKAASFAHHYDFNADGAAVSRRQTYENAMQQVRYYRSRRRPRMVKPIPDPREPNPDYNS